MDNNVWKKRKRQLNMFSRIRTSRGRLLGTVIAVVSLAAGIATLLQYWNPRADAELEEAELRARITTLDMQDDYAAGEAALGFLNLMYRRGYDMTGLTFPRMVLLMASFEGVDWSGNTMRRIEFGCTDQVYDQIRKWKEGVSPLAPCALLRDATFSGSRLYRVRFSYADLFNVDFTDASFEEVRFNDSDVSMSRFLGDVDLDGIRVDGSDFSHTRFPERATFRCTVRKCPEFNHSDFSSASIPGARFRNATFDQVDLAGSDLNEAHFDCDKSTAQDKHCSSLERLCLRETNLTDAVFEGITISHVDFSDSILDGARFINVRFENVVLPDRQVAMASLDEASSSSLNRKHGGVATIPWEDASETPCSGAWRDDLKGRKTAIAFKD